MADNINRFLDNYYVEQDSPLIIGEIELKQPDASVGFDKGAGPMQKQSKELFSAINKIYGGYLSAYSKEAYKKQFDIYPLRDFDAYMNTLGAVRTAGGRDFKGVGTKTDWYEVIREEREKRSKLYEDKITETRVDEKIEADEKKALNELTKSEIDQINVILSKETGTSILINSSQPTGAPFVNTQLQTINEKEEFIKLLRELTPNKKQIASKWQKIKTSFSKENQNSIDKILLKDNNAAFTPKKAEVDKLEAEVKKLEEEKQKILNDPKLSDTQRKTALEKKIETEKELKQKVSETKLKREQILGKTIEEEEQKKIHRYMNIWENNILERKNNDAINPYDGFTTQGPFCLEKQNYFKNVFRKSMNHYETEFREADYTQYTGNDEGNDIIEVTENIVTGVLKRKETPTTTNTGSGPLSVGDVLQGVTSQGKKAYNITRQNYEEMVKLMKDIFYNDYATIDYVFNWWRGIDEGQQNKKYIEFIGAFEGVCAAKGIYKSAAIIYVSGLNEREKIYNKIKAEVLTGFNKYFDIKTNKLDNQFFAQLLIFFDLNKGGREHYQKYWFRLQTILNDMRIWEIVKFHYDGYRKDLRLGEIK